MESSFKLFRVRGVEVGANWSWLIILALLIFVFANQLFPATYPNLETSTYWGMAVATAFFFVASLLLHELGHAMRAQREGMEIEGITLWLFGGVARFKGMFPSAGAEFRIAIAGPVVTVVIGAFFFGVTWVLNQVDAPPQVVGVTDYIARVNVLLLGFNLVPALPLDGGRVLRAYLWHRQRSFAAATSSAAKAGRAFGGVLIGVGILTLFTGGGFGGLWLALIGWFLMTAAQSEAAFALFRQSMSGLRVRDLMTPDPEVVEPDSTIASFIEDVAHARGHSTYPVVDGGKLVGLVSLRLAAKVPADERSSVAVRDIMLPADKVPTVRPDEEVFDAVIKIQSGPGRVVVVNDQKVVGILSASDIARAVEVQQIRGRPDEEPAAKGTPWLVWVVIGGLILAAGGYLYHPPVAVVAPGRSLDVTTGIEIDGTSTDEVDGRYLLTSVSVEQPNGLEAGLALLRGRDMVPISAVIPPDVQPEEFFERQRELFRETRLVAAAAAARAAGLEVDLTGTGAEVLDVLEGSPADDVLQRGDVITAIEGQPVDLADEVGRVIRSRPSGTTFVLTVVRDGAEQEIEVQSRAGVVQGQPGIGISVATRDFNIDLPFEVTFEELEIGGPSAGITYALAVYDILDPGDLAQGRDIASTGEIGIDGRVGPVGGVEEKAVTAREAGAELFLVPESEVEQARGTGLPVQGIDSLQGAIDFLEAGA